MLKIYIPTIGRIEKQLAVAAMPEKLRKDVYLVCPPEEVAPLQERWKVKTLACKAKGIAPTRDWILDHAVKARHQYIVQLDDDTTVQVRDKDYKIRDATPKQYLEAFEWFERKLKKYAHASWMPRYFGYDTPGEEFEGGKNLSIVGFDVARVALTGARFQKGMPRPCVMEDLNMTFQLLLAGLPNVISLRYRGDHHTRNAPGGCDTWRDNARHTRESALRLCELYPGFGRVKENKKTGGLDFFGYWKKAYLAGQRRAE